MQTKLELFSTEILSALENKEILSYFRVHRKSATSAQTDGLVVTNEMLYTGYNINLSETDLGLLQHLRWSVSSR